LTEPHHLHQPDDRINNRLGIAIGLNSVIVVVQVIGGLLSGSLALLSDSMHNLSDVAALAIALFAIKLARRPASPRYTYGLRRGEVLAALLNGATLLIVVTEITREAILRIIHPQAVQSGTVLIVATIGLIANAVSMLMLREHHADDLNMKSAFLHLLQDTISSAVVILSALLINLPYGRYYDPVASLVVALFVLVSGWKIVRDALRLLMEGTPQGVNPELIQRDIEAAFPIRNIHHLHVWEVGSGGRMLTAHIKMDDQSLSDAEQTLIRLQERLNDNWNISHSTLMPEVCGCKKEGLLPH